MKKVLFLLIIITLFSSCMKEKKEYINHDSEIFTGNDTLLFGDWEYLFSWEGGGYTGATNKINDYLSELSITPIDNYAVIDNGVVIFTGKIDIAGYLDDQLQIIFYPYGIKSSEYYFPRTFKFIADTLILDFGTHSDFYRDDYYLRK